MYSSFARGDRIAIRSALAAAWGFTALAGGGGVLIDLGSIVEHVGPVLPAVSSAIVLVFATIAAVGVVVNRYWMEWAAAWFVSGGVFVYVVLLWYLVYNGSDGRFQTAALLSGMLCFFAYRIIACAAHARKQRTIHKLLESGEVGLPNA
jgi:hypothetical protein